jgi:hypothetical protein
MERDDAADIRRIMDDILVGKSVPDSPHNFFLAVSSRCKGADIKFDGDAALEYWSILMRLGVVAVPGGHIGTFPGRLPQLLVTERGRKLLERGEQSPHDPPRFREAVRRRVREPDEIALAYLDEAVGAWTAGLYRASAVMLGCACERLVLILAAKVGEAGVTPWAGKIEKEMEGAPSRISRLFDLVRESLACLAGEKKLPGKLADALDRKLSAIFDHARGLRNKSGHPTGAEVSADEAEAGLLLFPGFYEFVDELCSALPESRPTA